MLQSENAENLAQGTSQTLVILGERSRVTFSFENKMNNNCCQVKGQGLCKLGVM